MAGPKANTIEYVFQGDTLDLQQAIKKVSELLTDAAKKLKQYQEGSLTKAQEIQLRNTRKLLKEMRALAQEGELSPEKSRKVLAAGREALRQAKRLTEQSARAEVEAYRKAEDEKLRISKLTSVAGQESARQHAAFLEDYADRLKSYLNPQAYDEIKRSVEQYRVAVQDTTLSEEQLANVTQNLQEAYKNYSETLQTAIRAHQTAKKGITSLKDVFAQLKNEIKDTLKSLSLWIRIVKEAIKRLMEGVQYAADFAEATNYLTVAAGESADELERFLELQQKVFGSDPTQLRTTAAMFYQIGNSLGWADEHALLLSKSFTSLAQDMASLQNVDLTTATEKLRAGLTGQARALRVWGIDVQDATIEQWLLSKGIEASMEKMNEASQTAARYAFILDRTTAAQGDLARTLKSPANQFKILSTQAKLLVQNMGASVIPIFTLLARTLNFVLMPLNAFLQATTASAVTGFTEGVGDASDALDEEAASLGQVGDEAKRASSYLTGIDEINQATEPGDISFEASEQGFGEIQEDIAALFKDIEKFKGKVQPLVDLFTSLGHVAAPFFDLLAATPLEIVGDLLYTLGDALTLLTTPLAGVSDTLGWLFTNVLGFLGDTLRTITDNWWLLYPAIAAVLALMAVSTWPQFIYTLGQMLLGIQQVTMAVWDGVKAFISWIAASVKAMFQAIAQTVKNWILAGSYWKVAIAAIAATTVAAVAVTAVVLAATGVASIEANSNLGTETSVPGLATGGVVRQPTLALIGEGAYDEAVVPLGNSPQFRAMRQGIAHETAQQLYRGYGFGGVASSPSVRAGGSQGRPLVLELNGKEVARGILPDIAYTQNQTGVQLR